MDSLTTLRVSAHLGLTNGSKTYMHAKILMIRLQKSHVVLARRQASCENKSLLPISHAFLFHESLRRAPS
mgnify:CR=1 FL=1|jgi:hypothetical protein